MIICKKIFSSVFILVLIKHLCRSYQMMRRDLYMIALVRQVYKKMVVQAVVQRG